MFWHMQDDAPPKHAWHVCRTSHSAFPCTNQNHSHQPTTWRWTTARWSPNRLPQNPRTHLSTETGNLNRMRELQHSSAALCGGMSPRPHSAWPWLVFPNTSWLIMRCIGWISVFFFGTWSHWKSLSSARCRDSEWSTLEVRCRHTCQCLSMAQSNRCPIACLLSSHSVASIKSKCTTSV